MKTTFEKLNQKQLNDLTQFLKKIDYEIELNSYNLSIEKISSEISEKFEKTISPGQVKALLHRILGLTLTSTERSQLYDLRKKIHRYEKFLNCFGEWGIKPEYLLKVIIIGLSDQQSETLGRILKKPGVNPGKSIIGVNFLTKLIENFDKSLTKLQIWDITRDIRFESIRTMYFKGALAAILVFNKESQESFDLIKNYYDEINKTTGLKAKKKEKGKKVKEFDMPLVIIAIGQKSHIPMDEIYSLSKNLGAQYFDLNEISDDEFQDALKYVAYQCLTRWQE